jgi:hypothetical protein
MAIAASTSTSVKPCWEECGAEGKETDVVLIMWPRRFACRKGRILPVFENCCVGLAVENRAEAKIFRLPEVSIYFF